MTNAWVSNHPIVLRDRGPAGSLVLSASNGTVSVSGRVRIDDASDEWQELDVRADRSAYECAVLALLDGRRASPFGDERGAITLIARKGHVELDLESRGGSLRLILDVGLEELLPTRGETSPEREEVM